MPWQTQANTSAASDHRLQPRFLAALGPWCGRPQKAEAATQLCHRREFPETADPHLGTHLWVHTPGHYSSSLTPVFTGGLSHSSPGLFHFHHFGDTASVPPQALRTSCLWLGTLATKRQATQGSGSREMPHAYWPSPSRTQAASLGPQKWLTHRGGHNSHCNLRKGLLSDH